MSDGEVTAGDLIMAGPVFEPATLDAARRLLYRVVSKCVSDDVKPLSAFRPRSVDECETLCDVFVMLDVMCVGSGLDPLPLPCTCGECSGSLLQ